MSGLLENVNRNNKTIAVRRFDVANMYIIIKVKVTVLWCEYELVELV